MIIKGKNISKTYLDGNNRLDVLKKLNFEVSNPEIILIKGPSGSGKTTLINILSTLDKPDFGEIEINNKTINYNASELDFIRSNEIGILFQSHYLLPEFTAFENLEIPFKINGIKNHYDPIDLLEEFNLTNKSDKFPHELSTGECQRIALLRSIINKPKIVFADEPTGNLDKENLYIMIKLINKMKINYNMTFIIATHDERLCDLADKIYHLSGYKLSLSKN